MKVYLGKYRSLFGPYQLAELLCFWTKPTRNEYGFEDMPAYVDKLGDFLCENTLVNKILDFANRIKDKTQIEYVKIDNYDIWNADQTLALIILPILKQLQNCKHGSPIVDFEDVPKYMRTPDKDYDIDIQFSFDFFEQEYYDVHDRWNWVLNEMIFSFEHIKENDYDVLCRDENGKLNHAEYNEYEKRIKNGLRLFGKYFRALWD